MHSYPSDITREQFEILRSDLESAKKVIKPRKKDLFDIFCAILYLVNLVYYCILFIDIK